MGLIRYGIHKPLEQEANRLLSESLKGVTRYADKADILTPWKEESRRRREVLVSTGAPDAATRRGQFSRVANPASPHLNSIQGVSRPGRISRAEVTEKTHRPDV